MGITILNLNPCYDRWVIMENEPPLCDVVRGDRVESYVSGKGMNIARALGNMGVENVRCINILGGEAGRIISERARVENLPVENYWIAAESRITTALVYESRNKLMMINEPGPRMTAAEWRGFELFAAEKISPGDRLILSGSAPAGIGSSELVRVLEKARRQGCRVEADIAGPLLSGIVDFGPDRLKINGDEFREAFRCGGGPDELKAFIKKKGLKELILTEGRDGSLAVSSEGICRARPLQKTKNRATGSGDSFFAGILMAREDGQGIREQLRWGTALGAVNANHYGSAVFSRSEAVAYYRNDVETEIKP